MIDWKEIREIMFVLGAFIFFGGCVRFLVHIERPFERCEEIVKYSDTTCEQIEYKRMLEKANEYKDKHINQPEEKD